MGAVTWLFPFTTGENKMGKKKKSEWKEFINKHNKPLSGREKYAQLKIDHDTGMYFIEAEGEMATKELTVKVIQELLKLVGLPDEVYNAVKENRDNIIRERQAESFKQHYDKVVKKESKEGYVYYLKEYLGNAIKIGHSQDPNERFKKFDFVPSVPVEIIYTIRAKDSYRLEQMLHIYFSKKKINNGFTREFFALTKEDMDNIRKRNLPEEMLRLILEEEHELPPRLKRLERKKQRDLKK